MAQANWYCYVCQTHGGGEPNEMSMKEHIDEVHDGGVVRMVEGTV